MSPENFCYFLQGFLEINNNGADQQMSAQQVQIIKDHLDLVFTKVTPNYVPLTSITSYPFYGDKTEDGFPRPIEYCGAPPQVLTTGIAPSWEETVKQVDEYGIGSLGTVGYFKDKNGVMVEASKFQLCRDELPYEWTNRNYDTIDTAKYKVYYNTPMHTC